LENCERLEKELLLLLRRRLGKQRAGPRRRTETGLKLKRLSWRGSAAGLGWPAATRTRKWEIDWMNEAVEQREQRWRCWMKMVESGVLVVAFRHAPGEGEEHGDGETGGEKESAPGRPDEGDGDEKR
jgi:hypothetical protein